MASDQLISSLDQVLALIVEDKEEFPSDDVLECVQDLLDHLRNNPQRAVYLSNASPWMANLRTVLSRLFQTFNIDEKYIVISFQLASAACSLVGTRWFENDSKFPLLLSSLASGRLRIVMEEPQDIKLSLLVPVLNVLLFFIEAVDDSDFFNDEDATRLCYHQKEASTYLFDYLVACKKENQDIPREVLVPIYILLCTFAAADGLAMLNQDTITDAVPILIDCADGYLSELDTGKAEMLLYNLPSFKVLPDTTLKFIINYLSKSIEPASINWALTKAVSVLEQLKGRTDYLVEADKEGLLRLAKQLEDDKLETLAHELFVK